LPPAGAQTFLSPDGPSVRITSPQNHATFYAPVDLSIFAYVHTADVAASLTNVEFYANGLDLGSGFDLGSIHAGLKPLYGNVVIGRPLPRLGSVFCFVWTNAPAGNFDLTAVARGHLAFTPLTSLSRTSAPVNITIITPATNSNPVNVVSIVATDPIAVAGTNSCWVWPAMTNPIPAWANWPPPRWQSLTNWGPKNALFTVHCLGDVSSNLTVNYNIGGTASNGVDYALLTNFITLPAGEAYALIPIVPVDNGSTNFAKTWCSR
jgi:hypothetical protein